MGQQNCPMSLSKVVAFFHNLVEAFLRLGRATSTDDAGAKTSSFASLISTAQAVSKIQNRSTNSIIVKIDGSAQILVVLTPKKMSYVVLGLFDNLVDPLRIYICNIKFFGCVVCFNSAIK